MRLINEITQEPIIADGEATATGLVRRRGVVLDLGEQRWAFERRTPLTFVLESSNGSKRVDVPEQGHSALPMLAPVVGYLVVRTFFKRRKKR